MYSSNSSIEISNLKISPSRKDVFMGAYCWGKEVQKLGPSFPFFLCLLEKISLKKLCQCRSHEKKKSVGKLAVFFQRLKNVA